MSDFVHAISIFGRIDKNGSYRFTFYGEEGRRHFSAVWAADGIAPAGTLTFSFDGNPGDPQAVIDLSAGDNAFSYNVRLPLVDVAVSGLPAGGALSLYCQ